MITQAQYKLLKQIINDPKRSIRHYSKNNDASYSFTNILCHQLEAAKMVVISKQKSVSFVSATPCGLQVHDRYHEIEKITESVKK